MVLITILYLDVTTRHQVIKIMQNLAITWVVAPRMSEESNPPTIIQPIPDDVGQNPQLI